MRVTLIGRKFKSEIILPKVPIGNYWLTSTVNGKEKKLVNIEGLAKAWEIKTSSYLKIIDTKTLDFNKDNNKINISSSAPVKFINKVSLEENHIYTVCLGRSREIYVLYCSPVYDDSFKEYNISGARDITIGSNKACDITYKNDYVEEKHARIFYNNDRFVLENKDKIFGTFVNDEPVYNNNKILSNGDVIFIMGLKIIIIGTKLIINNPLDKVMFHSEKIKIYRNKEINNIKLEDDDDNIELYSENDYFSGSPRITNVIEKEVVKIDPPPTRQSAEQMPLLLSLGSSLAMGLMMLVNTYSTINNKLNGTASNTEIAVSALVSILMLSSMILIPILTKKYDKKKKKEYEKLRQTKYKEYIDTRIQQIDDIMTKQRNILFENYASPEECVQIILNRSSRLWERKIEDSDFIDIRLGTGDVPLAIDIHYPEERFTLEDDNLVNILGEVGKKSKILKYAPIVLSLREKNICALISEDEETVEKFLQSALLQLITFHNYQDLKLVFFLREETSKRLSYIKMIPHIWNNTRELRFWADSEFDMDAISSYLEKVIQARSENKVPYDECIPYFLIITDDYKRVENLKIIMEILKQKNNFGFSILCITNNIMQLPKECKTFINIDKTSGKIFESEMSSNNQREFEFDTSQTFFFERICQTVANIPIKYNAISNAFLPDNYTFLEMYDVGRIEQLNILDRWKRNDSTLSLKAPIGIDVNQRQIALDIHEKYHGPHGLIAGSTGSGKSEFIITYILSLSVNFSPDDVTFILIDYKGGGLAGAFQKQNVQLPHLVGTITNIDTMGLQRSLASIQSELRRREIMFNKARDSIEEGTIDIYKYQKLYHEGVVKEAIPHLLIICDEFAELKQQEPDFMNELISVSRIGRSLGVHLILSTQKPAGIVNDQIRSNSKFGVCLKVQSTSDSSDVIKKPDAAYLKKAGEFYINVGSDDYFNLGQSALSSAPYYPQDIVKTKVDTSIEFISNIGIPIKKVDDQTTVKVENEGEQLTNIVRYMSQIAKEEGFKNKKLWLDNIPENIYLHELREKYHVVNDNIEIAPVIGEYDDPYNQKQGIVKLNLSAGKNTIIYGNAESGKESLLSTITYDLITNYTSDRVDLYLIDFGSESLKVFLGAPHVGDVVFINDSEKIKRLFNMIFQEIEDRKDILSEYGGDYNLYLKMSKKKLPLITVVLNNYEVFAENYNTNFEDAFLTLTREGPKYGIVFIVTTATVNGMRYRLLHNFNEKIVLQLNSDDEYRTALEGVGKKRPSHLFGRGLICRGEKKNIYEFQSAKITTPEDFIVHIREKIEEIKAVDKNITRKIPTMPDIVTLNDVKDRFRGLKQVPIGIGRNDLRVATYNFKKRFLNIITSKTNDVINQFTTNIIEELETNKDINIVTFNSVNTAEEISIREKFNSLVEAAKQNKLKETIVFIIGIDKFLSNINPAELLQNLRILEATKNCNIVLAESLMKIKAHEFEEWFKNYNTGDTGIWIGNGVDGQYLINIMSNRREIINNCGNSYGYLINQGNATLVKLLGMKENGDDDE